LRFHKLIAGIRHFNRDFKICPPPFGFGRPAYRHDCVCLSVLAVRSGQAGGDF
jgi:hypothetical protein